MWPRDGQPGSANTATKPADLKIRIALPPLQAFFDGKARVHIGDGGVASQWGAWSDGESNVDGKPPVFLCLVQVHMIILHGLYRPFLRVGLVPSLARAAA